LNGCDSGKRVPHERGEDRWPATAGDPSSDIADGSAHDPSWALVDRDYGRAPQPGLLSERERNRRDDQGAWCAGAIKHYSRGDITDSITRVVEPGPVRGRGVAHDRHGTVESVGDSRSDE
jgi:hypothetical protein